jgi:hypothetical protein
MATGNELKAAEDFIYGQLAANAPLVAATTGIFSASAPRGQLSPFVTFLWQTSTDVTIVGSVRIAIEPLFLVKVIGQTGTFHDIQGIADMIDASLHNSQGSKYGMRIAQCVRTGTYEMVDNSTEIPWRHLGGYYQLYISVI